MVDHSKYALSPTKPHPTFILELKLIASQPEPEPSLLQRNALIEHRLIPIDVKAEPLRIG